MAGEPNVFNSHENKWLRLIFNETLLLLNRDGEVWVNLGSETSNWILRIQFSNEGFMAANTLTHDTQGKEIIIKLNRWFSETGIENTEPLYFQSADKSVEIYVKIKTVASMYQKTRTLTITVWKATKENK
jgi:hypothetical protein